MFKQAVKHPFYISKQGLSAIAARRIQLRKGSQDINDHLAEATTRCRKQLAAINGASQ